MTNVNLGPKEDARDQAARVAEAVDEEQREKAQEQLSQLKTDLERQEATQVLGAPVRSPKEDILDARALEAKHPNKYHRYLNTANKDRMPGRIHREGFRPVDKKEAEAAGVNASVGNLVLSEQPWEIHDRRIAAQNAENERRLKAHEATMEQVVDSVVRDLRDKHGIKVDPKRLLVNE